MNCSEDGGFRARLFSPRNHGSFNTPLVLPTTTKYHMDMTRSYRNHVLKNCSTQTEDVWEQRPSTAPDSFNVINVCARLKPPQECSPHVDSNSDVERNESDEFDKNSAVNRPSTAPAPDILQGKQSGRKEWNIQEHARPKHDWEFAMACRNEGEFEMCSLLKTLHKANVVTKQMMNSHLEPVTHNVLECDEEQQQQQQHKHKHICVVERKEHVKKQEESARWCDLNPISNNGGDLDMMNIVFRRHEDSTPWRTGDEGPRLIKLTRERIMERLTLVDHQIETFLQAYVLQCCILFRSMPQLLL